MKLTEAFAAGDVGADAYQRLASQLHNRRDEIHDVRARPIVSVERLTDRVRRTIELATSLWDLYGPLDDAGRSDLLRGAFRTQVDRATVRGYLQAAGIPVRGRGRPGVRGAAAIRLESKVDCATLLMAACCAAKLTARCRPLITNAAMTRLVGGLSHVWSFLSRWLHSQPAAPDSIIDIAQAMHVDAEITGTIAGFALAVVILLIDHTRRHDDPGLNRTLEAAIFTFFAAFFTLVFTSFVFAEGSGQQPPASHRAFVIFTCPLFMFSISLTFLFVGFIILLGAYQLQYVLATVRWFYLAGLFLVSVYYSSAIDDATSRDLADSVVSAYTAVAVVVTGLAALVPRWHRRRWTKSRHLTGLRRYVLISMSACVACYLIMSWVENQSNLWVAPRWLGVLLLFALCGLAGWSTTYMPDRRQMARGHRQVHSETVTRRVVGRRQRRFKGDDGRGVVPVDPWDAT